MIGKLEKNYYKVGIVGESVTADDVFNALRSQISGRFTVSEYDAEKEYEEIKNIRDKFNQKQKTTVPIQFVWHDGTLSHIDAVNAESWICFENCTVEQIGAVLYVRGE